MREIIRPGDIDELLLDGEEIAVAGGQDLNITPGGISNEGEATSSAGTHVVKGTREIGGVDVPASMTFEKYKRFLAKRNDGKVMALSLSLIDGSVIRGSVWIEGEFQYNTQTARVDIQLRGSVDPV